MSTLSAPSATELRLPGCRAEPLGTYLCGLGTFRLVAEQVDREARAYWDGDVLVLRSRLNRDSLLRFLLDEYAPTPIVSPWNGGSGFQPKDKGGRERLMVLESAETPRLASYQATTDAARRVTGLAGERGWVLGGGGAKGKSAKERWVRACRALYPDEALPWLDVAVVLTGEELAFPAVVGGTGGNFGRLDLSATFAGHVAAVLGLTKRPQPTEGVRAWLEEILFGEPSARLSDSAGAYEPAAAGGATSGESLVNPWGGVLAIEGALLFAASSARRLGSRRAGAAAPFTTNHSAVGYATASEENVKGELWAPLWSAPCSLEELSRLFGEGRASWGRTQAARGVDFALAAASLGVDRGVDRFVRHGLIERYGQNLLAIPLGRVDVRERAEVSVVGRVQPWLDALRRRSDPPAAVRLALARVEQARWRLATGSGASLATADLLIAIAQLESAVARAKSFRERTGVGPVQARRDGRWFDLEASDWLPHLGDSVELRLAAALASCADGPERRLAFLFRPVERDERRRLVFRPGGAVVPGLGLRPLAAVLADALVARGREAQQADGADEGGIENTAGGGVLMGYRWSRPAEVADVEAYLSDRVDERRLADLLAGCSLLRWSGRPPPARKREHDPLPTAYSLMAPFAQPAQRRPARDSDGPPTDDRNQGLVDRDREAPTAETLRMRPSWAAALRAGRTAEVIGEALGRLRIAGLDPVISVRRGDTGGAQLLARQVDAQRLPGALLLPLRAPDVANLLRAVCPPEPTATASPDPTN